MASTARAALIRVTHTAPLGKKPGSVAPFTRHPTALAAALVFIRALRHPDGSPLRHAERALHEVVAMNCDRDGLWWGSVNDVAAITGLSPHTIRVAARKCKPLGLVGWKWIKAHHRFPQRKGYFEGIRWAKGTRTHHGGRVWAFSWAQVGVQFEEDRSGTKLAGLILQDQSRLIPEDQSTSGSSCFAYTDPGLRGPDADRDQSPLAPPSSPPEREKRASETPSAGEGSAADSRASAAVAPESQRQGDGRGGQEPRGEPRALTREQLAEVAAGLEFLYKPASRQAPAPPEHRRPRRPSGGESDS